MLGTLWRLCRSARNYNNRNLSWRISLLWASEDKKIRPKSETKCYKEWLIEPVSCCKKNDKSKYKFLQKQSQKWLNKESDTCTIQL